MTDVGKVQMTKITIKKGQGLTQALGDLVKEQKMVMSDGSISAAEWNKTIDKLAELQEKRKADGKESIFSGGTDRHDFKRSFVVHPNQEIKFSEEEMKELYEAMGVSFANAKAEEEEETTTPPAAPEPTETPVPTETPEPTATAAPEPTPGHSVTVGDGNNTTVVIIGDDNTVIIGGGKTKPPKEVKDPEAPTDPTAVEEPEQPEKLEEPGKSEKTKDSDASTQDPNKTIIDGLKDVIRKLLDLIGIKDVTPVDQNKPIDVKKPEKEEKTKESENPTTPGESKIDNAEVIAHLLEVIKHLLEQIDAKEPVKVTDPQPISDKPVKNEKETKEVYVNFQPGECYDYKNGKLEKVTFKNAEEEQLWRYQNIKGLTSEQSAKIKTLKSVDEIIKYLESQGIKVKIVC